MKLRLPALILFCSTASAAPLYTAIPLSSTNNFNVGLLNVEGDVVAGINSAGEVAATSNNGSAYFGFLYNGTTVQTLPTLGGTNSYASGINSSGDVTGTSQITGNSVSQAYYYNGSTIVSLGSLVGSSGQSSGNAINASGEIAGSSATSGPSHAFLWNGSTMQNLGSLQGATGGSFGYGINNAGEVTGTSTVSGGGQDAFIWNGSTMVNIGALPVNSPFTPYAVGLSINNSGDVVGYSDTTTATHAFFYNGATMMDLGTLPGYTDSYALSVNDSGEAVGFDADSAFSNPDAFLWTGSQMVDLNTMLSNSSDWYITFANAINDNGQIAGYAVYTGSGMADGIYAVLLTPTSGAPEPATLWLFTAAGLLLTAKLWSRL